ncbi:apolipoprotein N-acyltransferase [Trichloromonas sp.]|uniref:apolipoprotein N-acyltransferase n=1 Tax=Trichloromonas sp. TaxID=3069249 RepID=UPI002A413CCF|nr:apolipoprotein N-acyltransferase [Trichloromonas sp.]
MKLTSPGKTAALSLLSGLLLALAFPRPDFSWLAWFGLVPLLTVMERHPFRSGFVAGCAFFGLVLYWLNIVMTTYGRMHPFFSLVAYVLLVAYLALFFGLATWAVCRFREQLGRSYLLTLPVVWVALEFLRSFLLSGFPWASLGYSQQNREVLLQSVDLFGVHGLSFLIVFANVLVFQLWRSLARRGSEPLSRSGVAIGLLLIIAAHAYGFWRLGLPEDATAPTLEVALIQGNIDQSVKWDPAYQQKTVEIYRELSREATADGAPDLIVWPESATPFYFQEPGPLSAQVTEVSRAIGGHLLFGSPAYEKGMGSYRYLNSAFLLSPSGVVLGRSDKVHLVPFGEYVPLGRFLPFIDKLVTGIGDFSPGTVNPLPLEAAKLGVLVCFEGIFPELARDYAASGSGLLVNITNDAWFGRSSAPHQHLAMTRFRAVENRLWLARAANTGISALIDPKGRIVARSELFAPAVVRGKVLLGGEATLYQRIGELPALLFCALAVFWLIRTRRRYP